jgi:hypothetical protein
MEIIYKAPSKPERKKSYQIANCWLKDLRVLENERNLLDKSFKSHLLSAYRFHSFNIPQVRKRLEYINKGEVSLRDEIAAHHMIIELNIKELAGCGYEAINAVGSALEMELGRYKSSYREYRRALDQLTEALLWKQE